MSEKCEGCHCIYPVHGLYRDYQGSKIGPFCPTCYGERFGRKYESDLEDDDEESSKIPARGETLRSLNRCKKCSKIWYPRGSDRSDKCPTCGSTEVQVLRPE